MPPVYHRYTIERVVLENALDMPRWVIEWMEIIIIDGVTLISMAPKVSLGYMVWWIAMQTWPLGLAEFDSEGDGGESPSSKEDDQMNVDNLIHDGLP